VSLAPPSSGATTVSTPITQTYYIAALLADFNVESIAYFDSGLGDLMMKELTSECGE
jgi:hypothetical protein